MTDQRGPPDSTKTVWAYGYEITPPQSQARLRTLRNLLDRKQSEAREGPQSWQCRFVFEPKVTHILVVSDSPRQDHEFNRHLEAALREMKVGFSLTAPLAVPAEPIPAPHQP